MTRNICLLYIVICRMVDEDRIRIYIFSYIKAKTLVDGTR